MNSNLLYFGTGPGGSRKATIQNRYKKYEQNKIKRYITKFAAVLVGSMITRRFSTKL